MTSTRLNGDLFRLAVALLALVLMAPVGGVSQTSPVSQPQASAGEPTLTHYSLPPEKLEKAAALYRTQVVLFLAGSLYGFVVLLGLLRFDIGPRFRNIAERVTRFRFVQAYIFVRSRRCCPRLR